jgi:hypothetical protein
MHDQGGPFRFESKRPLAGMHSFGDVIRRVTYSSLKEFRALKEGEADFLIAEVAGGLPDDPFAIHP